MYPQVQCNSIPPRGRTDGRTRRGERARGYTLRYALLEGWRTAAMSAVRCSAMKPPPMVSKLTAIAAGPLQLQAAPAAAAAVGEPRTRSAPRHRPCQASSRCITRAMGPSLVRTAPGHPSGTGRPCMYPFLCTLPFALLQRCILSVQSSNAHHPFEPLLDARAGAQERRRIARLRSEWRRRASRLKSAPSPCRLY